MRGALRIPTVATVAILIVGTSRQDAVAEDWNMYLCVDNFFDAYYGDSSTTLGYIGGGNDYNTTYNFFVPGRASTDYLYVVGVSDHFSDQGFIGVFTNTTLNRTIHTDTVIWQVFPAGAHAATNPFFPSPWPAATLPTQAQVNTAISYATSNNLWITPADPAGDVNDGTVFGGARTNIPVSANWIWYNTGLGPDPANPMHGGYNHNEFLVFRLLGAVPPEPILLINSAPGTFIDISASGTPLPMNDDDEAVITTTIGNAAFPAGTVVVGNNGGLAFPSVTGQNDLAPANTPIPNASAFNGRQCALGYWDDLKGDDFFGASDSPRGGKNGSVRWQEIGNVLVVQWNNRPVAGTQRVNDTVKFQAKVFGGVGIAPGAQYGQFIYADVNQAGPNGGASATIAYQGGISGFADFQWSFDTPASVNNGTVLTVTSPGGGPPTNAVPAVSDVGMVVMVLLFLTAGSLVFRRSARVRATGP